MNTEENLIVIPAMPETAEKKMIAAVLWVFENKPPIIKKKPTPLVAGCDWGHTVPIHTEFLLAKAVLGLTTNPSLQEKAEMMDIVLEKMGRTGAKILPRVSAILADTKKDKKLSGMKKIRSDMRKTAKATKVLAEYHYTRILQIIGDHAGIAQNSYSLPVPTKGIPVSWWKYTAKRYTYIMMKQKE
jgi:hypothetical protein